MIRYQLRAVAGALRSSEKRKSVAVASSVTLKRDLVLEKCQRSEYVDRLPLDLLPSHSDDAHAGCYSSAKSCRYASTSARGSQTRRRCVPPRCTKRTTRFSWRCSNSSPTPRRLPSPSASCSASSRTSRSSVAASPPSSGEAAANTLGAVSIGEVPEYSVSILSLSGASVLSQLYQGVNST